MSSLEPVRIELLVWSERMVSNWRRRFFRHNFIYHSNFYSFHCHSYFSFNCFFKVKSGQKTNIWCILLFMLFMPLSKFSSSLWAHLEFYGTPMQALGGTVTPEPHSQMDNSLVSFLFHFPAERKIYKANKQIHLKKTQVRGWLSSWEIQSK